MSDLAGFILARVAEDEEVATATLNTSIRVGVMRGVPVPRWHWGERSVIYSDGGTDDEVVRVRHTWKQEGEHIIRWDPARVLAECEKNRRIVDVCLAWPRKGEHIAPWPRNDTADSVLRLLALPYADHPDYQESWRP